MATYLGQALEKSNLTNDLRSFLISCFKDSEFYEQLSELLYEAIETTCGIQTSIQGYLSTAFVLNCMTLANVIESLSSKSDENSEKRFVQFIKDVLMQQIFQNEDARLLVLDTLCILCQDLQNSLVESKAAGSANVAKDSD